MQEEAEVIETETTTDRLIRKTPWWAISAGVHAVVALVLAFVVVIGAPDEDEDAVVVSPPRKVRPIPEMDPPKELTENKKSLEMEATTEEVIFRKVEQSDKIETADDEPFESAKGDSLEFKSDTPFKDKGHSDMIGSGGPPGGRFGTRKGGNKDLCINSGGGGGTQGAVLNALKWLARHQNPDGSWSVRGYTDRCKDSKCAPNPGEDGFDAGVTGLSILAFLGAGFSHMSRETYDGICFGDVVRKGLQWMMSHQDPEGCIGSRSASQYMYNHCLCALALCEGYGLTGSMLFKDQAQKAVDFTVAAQNPDKGWRYSYRAGDNDSSVTGWAVMVLKSAEISQLSFPRSSYEGTRNWYDEVTDDTYYRVGYTFKGSGHVYDEHNREFAHHEALTAIGMMSRIFLDKDARDPRLSGGASLLTRDLPKWDDKQIDFYYWYYASLALFQFDGPKGPSWTAWNKSMKEALVPTQNMPSTGCKRGSWEPVDRWSCEGGRVYATAINALTLEVYYRYANVFGSSK